MSEERKRTLLIGIIIVLATAIASVIFFSEEVAEAIGHIGNSCIVAICGLLIGLTIATYLGTYVKYKHYLLKNNTNNVAEPFDRRYFASAGLTAVICALSIGLIWMNGWFKIDSSGVTWNTESIKDFVGSLVGNLKQYTPLLETAIAVLSQALILIKTFNRNVELNIAKKEALEANMGGGGQAIQYVPVPQNVQQMPQYQQVPQVPPAAQQVPQQVPQQFQQAPPMQNIQQQQGPLQQQPMNIEQNAQQGPVVIRETPTGPGWLFKK